MRVSCKTRPVQKPATKTSPTVQSSSRCSRCVRPFGGVGNDLPGGERRVACPSRLPVSPCLWSKRTPPVNWCRVRVFPRFCSFSTDDGEGKTCSERQEDMEPSGAIWSHLESCSDSKYLPTNPTIGRKNE